MSKKKKEFRKPVKGSAERRFFPVGQGNVEIRGEGDSREIFGHTAVFNSETIIGNDWYREVIRPGAFKRTLENGTEVLALFNHNPNFVLGRRSAETIKELKEDKVGLFYSVEPPDTTWANDLWTSINRGDITGNSFGFRVIEEKWTYMEEQLPLRELIEVEIFDVGPVTFPAYDDTNVSARSDILMMAANKSGIDMMELSGILYRMQDDKPLSIEDRNQLQTIISQLSTLATDPTPDQDEDPLQERHFSHDLELAKLNLYKHEIGA